jgi:hypothetical protein
VCAAELGREAAHALPVDAHACNDTCNCCYPPHTNITRRGRTVGELGNDAAQELSGAEGKAASSGARVEEK